PVGPTTDPATRLLYRVHTDIVQLPVQNQNKFLYWIIYVDEWSRWIEIVGVHDKSQYFSETKQLKERWERQHNLKIVQWRSDDSLFRETVFQEWCKKEGMVPQVSPPYTKEFNGLAESNIRTMKEMADCYREHATLPLSFTFEALRSASFTKNRVIHSFTHEVPFFRWYGRLPDLSLVKQFGCEVWGFIPPEKRNLQTPAKAQRGLFMGYAGNMIPLVYFFSGNSYHGSINVCYNIQWDTRSFPGLKRNHSSDPPRNLGEGEIFSENQNVIDNGDNEELFWMVIGDDDAADSDDKSLQSTTFDDPVSKRYAGEQRGIFIGRLAVLAQLVKARELSEFDAMTTVRAFAAAFLDGIDTVYPDTVLMINQLPPPPKTIKELLLSPFASKWVAATMSEYNALINKGVWTVVDRPKGVNIITCKWIWTYKENVDGSVSRFKARLVARGFTQRYGIHYDKTFSPVVKIQSVRTLLAAAFLAKMHIHVFDIDVAYLNGEMDIVNYMKMPQGFEQYNEKGEPMVCNLKKGLYGTKQAGRMWNIVLVRYLTEELQFIVTRSDPCVMILKGKLSPNGESMILTIYVDDSMIASRSIELIDIIKKKFKEKFGIRDMGPIKWLLKIQIERRKEKGVEVLWLGQPQYIEHVLDSFADWVPIGGRKIMTPMIVGWKHDDVSPLLIGEDLEWYRSVIACLSYLALQSRLDIMFATNHLAQFSRAPRVCDKMAVSRILGYLKNFPDLGPTYFRTENMQEAMQSFMKDEGNTLSDQQAPHGYADASWGTEQDYRSRTGIVFRFAGGPITWYSGKQIPVAVSSAEAELYALSDGVKDGIFQRNLLNELGINLPQPTLMMEDNEAAKQIAEDPKFHARVKHIGIRLGFIRDMIKEKLIAVKWCPTDKMLADILTKALPEEQHWLLLFLIGMRCLSNLDETDVTP
ncbi:MAG: hypothetical protein RIS29_564, partial [Bacteroidota bacterium]